MKAIYLLFGFALTFSGLSFFTAQPPLSLPKMQPLAPSAFSVPNFYKRAAVLTWEQEAIIMGIREDLDKAGELSKLVSIRAKRIGDKRRKTTHRSDPNSYPVKFTAIKSD